MTRAMESGILVQIGTGKAVGCTLRDDGDKNSDSGGK